ncbi:MAG: threonylcarbamoyl-AMP synthase [Polyangiaceae bacterium]|nr:threonylcarbamoyl-AMP synthase [Polyangiaceae bacterium]
MTHTERLTSDAAGIARAAALLAAGEVVAFPTETVYGLGVRADDAAAVRRLYAAKGRPEDKPLIVHVPGPAAAEGLAARWDARARALAAAFWPGPLTLVVPRGAGLCDEAVGGGTSVGVRMPAHAVALALVRVCSFPVAAPSANLSGEAPARDAEEVLARLGGRIAAVVDGGRSGDGAPSTVVDLTCEPARILRPGALAAERVAAVVALA